MADEIEEYDDENIVKIEEDGKEYYFEELDRVEYDDKKYIALIPLDEEEIEPDEDDGNVIILQVIEENGEQYLAQIENEKLFNEIGNIIEDRLIEKYEQDEDVTVQKREN